MIAARIASTAKNKADPAQIIFGSTRRTSAFRANSRTTQTTINPILIRRRASPPKNNPPHILHIGNFPVVKNSRGCPSTTVGT